MSSVRQTEESVQQLIDLLQSEGEMTNDEIQKRTGWSISKVFNIKRILREKGLTEDVIVPGKIRLKNEQHRTKT